MAAYTEILRSLREDHDMTQAQVAAALGTTQQVYARYEKGRKRAAAAAFAGAVPAVWSQRGLHFGPAGGAEAPSLKISAHPTKIFQIFIKIRENPLTKGDFPIS